ncbi:MAG: acetamidase/formamidase family protein [Candidatus Acidiferrales bacterium]
MFVRRLAILSALATTVAFSCLAQSNPVEKTPRVVQYHTTIDVVKYVYGPAQPVEHLHSGDILETNTLDCFGDAIKKPGDTLAMAKGDNPLTGPFYIDDAAPGDTLAIDILGLEVNSNQGIGGFAPGFGALSTTNYTPMLNPALPERLWFYPIDHKNNTATFRAYDSDFSATIPLHIFLGCIGVAPADGESRSSVVPAEFGGNMDAPEVSVGNTLYLPVNVAGALLFMGDGHAAMGDGEVAGSAIEVALRVRLRVRVIKGKAIAWPRFENEHEIMAAGIYRPVDDALRIAFTQLIAWMHADYGLSEYDSYELLSQVGKIHLTEMVDPNYVVIASIDKKYLPPQKN